MKATLAFAAALGVTAISPAVAQTDAGADVAAIDAAVSALEADDPATATRIIANVEQAFGERIAWTPAEAVALLAGCDAMALGQSELMAVPIHVYRWDCGDGEYSGALAANQDGHTVTLVDLATGDDASRLLSPPPPPPPVLGVRLVNASPEVQEEMDRRREEHRRELDLISLRKGERFARLLQEGDIEMLASAMNQYSSTRLSFQANAQSQPLVEMNGMDAEALVAQLEFIHATLGQPTAHGCDIVAGETVCTWQFPDPDTRLRAIINGCCDDRWLIGRIDFRYSTQAKLEQYGMVSED